MPEANVLEKASRSDTVQMLIRVPKELHARIEDAKWRTRKPMQVIALEALSRTKWEEVKE